MRIGALAANVVAIVFCVALCALFVWLVGRVGFLGAAIAGLLVLLVSFNVELQDGSAIGSAHAPGVYAS